MLHYCRHCAWKTDNEPNCPVGVTHSQWVAHYYEEHEDIADPIIKSTDGRCTKNCLGRPLADEVQRGQSTWGRCPEFKPEPIPNALAKLNALFSEDDDA